MDVNVCCLYFKDEESICHRPNTIKHFDYDFSYVEKLYNMVKRNTNKRFNFYCLTHIDFDHKDIIKLPLIETHIPLSTFDKLRLFKKDLLLNLPTIYFDIDIVITSNIDFLFNYTNTLTMVDSIDGKTSKNGSVIGWIPNDYDWIYEEYLSGENYLWPDDAYLDQYCEQIFPTNKIAFYFSKITNDNHLPYKFNKEHSIISFAPHFSKQNYYIKESNWITDYWY